MKINLSKIKALYRKYRRENLIWSFGGFLTKIGIGRYDLETLKKFVRMGDNEAVELAAFLDDIRYEYCNLIDEMLVYQQKHPTIQMIGAKYVNYTSLQYVSSNLKKQLENYDSFNLTKAENKIPVLENKSGVSLLAVKQKSS